MSDKSPERIDWAKRMTIRTHGLMRLIMVRHLSERLGCYTVAEYPKCGGSWLGEMLAMALDLPFPRNSFPVPRASILHGHYLRHPKMRKVVVLWRDPRDVIVSQYHHSFFLNELHNDVLVAVMRQAFAFDDYDDLQTNLPRFIRRMYEDPVHPHFSYSGFIDSWHGAPDIVTTSYEALRADTESELARVVEALTGEAPSPERISAAVESNTFARVAKREPGVEKKDSFARAGIVGGWVKHFSEEARHTMSEMAQRDLELLGYETDASWVSG